METVMQTNHTQYTHKPLQVIIWENWHTLTNNNCQ